ncbi:universal stress protein [Microbacterium sp.]|uniref:universal stress protein n=1 Tax=Microbacterium sp. TaxID=51671 RepID=UPI001AD2E26E|nr:universal stress protein [Microbacterium sp.]MBN9158102.1 universal stress protein [Microbacterium sp.]
MNTTADLPILVGVDGSASSVDALRYAVTLAGALGRPIRAVMTWDYAALIDLYPTPGRSPEKETAAHLDAVIARAFTEGRPAVLTTRVVAGPPASVLIAESRHAEMLVLGTRGRGGFTGLLLGSVSAACAAHAHCPVLIVRHEKQEGRGEKQEG